MRPQKPAEVSRDSIPVESTLVAPGALSDADSGHMAPTGPNWHCVRLFACATSCAIGAVCLHTAFPLTLEASPTCLGNHSIFSGASSWAVSNGTNVSAPEHVALGSRSDAQPQWRDLIAALHVSRAQMSTGHMYPSLTCNLYPAPRPSQLTGLVALGSGGLGLLACLTAYCDEQAFSAMICALCPARASKGSGKICTW
jgi:hypothetical protein